MEKLPADPQLREPLIPAQLSVLAGVLKFLEGRHLSSDLSAEKLRRGVGRCGGSHILVNARNSGKIQFLFVSTETARMLRCLCAGHGVRHHSLHTWIPFGRKYRSFGLSLFLWQ